MGSERERGMSRHSHWFTPRGLVKRESHKKPNQRLYAPQVREMQKLSSRIPVEAASAWSKGHNLGSTVVRKGAFEGTNSKVFSPARGINDQ